MVTLLNLPGTPVPEWFGFLLPVVALILCIKAGEWLRNKYRHRKLHQLHTEHDASVHDGGGL